MPPACSTDVGQSQKVLADPAVRARLASFGEAKGIELLVVGNNGPLMVASHKPIRTAADFKGQKIRVPGAAPLHIQPFKKLGASPVSIPLGEVLPALQNNTIDGSISSFNVLTGFKYYDVTKTATYLPESFLFVAGVVNRNFMKQIGPELATIVREEARKAEVVFSTYGVEDVEKHPANLGQERRRSDHSAAGRGRHLPEGRDLGDPGGDGDQSADEDGLRDHRRDREEISLAPTKQRLRELRRYSREPSVPGRRAGMAAQAVCA